MLAFYSNDPSSNPAEAYSFFAVKFVFKNNENKLKETVVGPFKKKKQFKACVYHKGIQS